MTLQKRNELVINLQYLQEELRRLETVAKHIEEALEEEVIN